MPILFFYSDEVKQIITSYLGADNFASLKHDSNEFFGIDDEEELWSNDLPDDIEVLLKLTVDSPKYNYNWGLIRLCTYKGRKCVIEECSSPIILHYFDK